MGGAPSWYGATPCITPPRQGCENRAVWSPWGRSPSLPPSAPSLVVLPSPRRAGVTSAKKRNLKASGQGCHPRGCNAPWKCRMAVRSCMGLHCSVHRFCLQQKWGDDPLCRFRTRGRPLSLPLTASRSVYGTHFPSRPPSLPSLPPFIMMVAELQWGGCHFSGEP